MRTQTVKGVDHVTFGKFAQSLASNHTSTLRTPLEARRISDNLDSEINIHRAALHCICWVISRIFSNECRHLSWYDIFWSVSSSSALPGFLQQILVLLNRRNKLYDYIICGYGNDEEDCYYDQDYLPDFSSYLACKIAFEYELKPDS